MKKIKLLWLALIVLILNLVWEFSHYRLYNDLTGISSNFHLIIASFGDVFLVFLIFGLISIKYRHIRWLKKPLKLDYFLIIIYGTFLAIIIEIVNLNLGRWSYKGIMPTIFGVGLSPLLQLSITGILSLLIFKKFNY